MQPGLHAAKDAERRQPVQVVDGAPQQGSESLHDDASGAQAFTPLALEDAHRRLGLPPPPAVAPRPLGPAPVSAGHAGQPLHLPPVRGLGARAAPVARRDEALGSQPFGR